MCWVLHLRVCLLLKVQQDFMALCELDVLSKKENTF